MIECIEEGTRIARKTHQCFDCYRPIPAGSRHYFFTGVADGAAYTLHSHEDCRAAVLDFIADVPASDFWDGVPPLADQMKDSGEFDAICDQMRGHFPHVIARLELGEQLAEVRWERMLRERGLAKEARKGMSDYVETFLVNRHSYAVERCADGTFAPWHNGCRIGRPTTLEEARTVIHSHAVSQLRAEVAGHQERVLHARRALDKLDGDVFHLGRFSAQ